MKVRIQVLPLAYVVLAVAMSKGLSVFFPLLQFNRQYSFICSLVIALPSLALLFCSAFVFKKRATTLNPFTPEMTSSLVVEGLYAYTRNPMYLAMAGLVLSGALFNATLTGYIPVVLFVAIIHFRQILPEERALESLFGNEYKHYKNSVRRWI